MAYMRDPGKKVIFPLIAFYATDGTHKIMVDTGGTAPDSRYQPHTRTPEQEPVAVLSRLGVNPDEVTHVILTHLHWDHAGNNQLFSNAKIYVQKSELQFAVAPLRIQSGAYDYDLIFKTRYEVVEGDTENLLPGVSVIATPGHSPGSQSVIVDTEKGKYLIPGDLIGLFECYESDPMLVNGLHTDLEVYYRSLDRIKKLNCVGILPGHEIKIFDHAKYPYK